MTPGRGDPAVYVTHFHARVLCDAWLEGSASYWERRARQFEWAMPRSGDYVGRSTLQQRAAQAARCTAEAQVCRGRATGPWTATAIADLVDALDDFIPEVAA